MKGYRTIVFNLVMLVAGLTGAEVEASMIDSYVEYFLGAWAAGNVILRWVTSSPIFEK